MSFVEDFVRAWGEGGHAAAFAVVEKLFKDPANQKRKGKPTDFLHDEDEDEGAEADTPAARRRRERQAKKNMPPAQGFAEFVDGFKPKRAAAKTAEWILDRLDESRTENPAWDERHAFQPWNMLQLHLGHYERLDVIAHSLHESDGKRVDQYGLQHEIIGDGDTVEEYNFTYRLGNDDDLTLHHGEEQVPGKVAHGAAKAAIYAPYLRQVVDALVASERFAVIPKALPFRFRLDTHEYAEAKFEIELAPPLDAAALATHPLRDVYLEAAKAREITRDDRFFYALQRARKDPAALADLIEIVRGAPDLVEVLRIAAEDNLLRTRTIDAHGSDEEVIAAAIKGDSRLEQIFRDGAADDSLLAKVRAFAPSVGGVVHILRAAGAADLARELAIARLDLPAPRWQAHDDDAVRVARQHLGMLRQLLAQAPGEERALLQPRFDAALERFASADHPLVALMVLEEQVSPEQLEALASEAEVDDEDSDEDSDENVDDDAPDDTAPPPPDADAFEELEPAAKVLVREASPRYVAAVIASIAARQYGRLTNETSLRLKALGAKARAAEAPLRALLTEMCADGYNHDNEVAPVAEILWRIGAEDVPAEVHKAHRSNQFFMEEFYPKWAKAAPARKLERLLGALRAEPASAAAPGTWEDGLYDSGPGFEMFRKAISAAPERDAWIAGLCRALAEGAGDVTFRFTRDWARDAAKKDQRLALTLFETIEDRLTDEPVATSDSGQRKSDKQRLRRARMHRLTELLEADDPGADAELVRVRTRYPDDPTVSFLETMRAARREGPRVAGERTISHARRMSVDDIVYRKAFFQYTHTTDERWESVDVGHAFALHEIGEKKFRKGAWTDGKLDANPYELDQDPFYEGMEHDVSELSADELAATLSGYRRAVAVLDGAAGDLAAALDPASWEVSWLVAKKLARDPSRAHIGKLVEVYGWFAEDETHRRQLARLLWPLPGAREVLLAAPVFRAHLADFIADYPLPSDQLAREVFAHFAERGQYEHIIAASEGMKPRLVTQVAISILTAYSHLARWDDAIELCKRVQKETKPKAPEWVLHSANLAAMQSKAGRLDDAEATLADLFSRDWSRFDHDQPPDEFATKVLGGDLDVQYAQVFRRYWAQAKFNAACLYAQRGRPAEAVSALREAIRNAPAAYPAAKLRAEADFATISDHAEFQALLAELPAGGAS
jgi:hypothetical protein